MGIKAAMLSVLAASSLVEGAPHGHVPLTSTMAYAVVEDINNIDARLKDFQTSFDGYKGGVFFSAPVRTAFNAIRATAGQSLVDAQRLPSEVHQEDHDGILGAIQHTLSDTIPKALDDLQSNYGQVIRKSEQGDEVADALSALEHDMDSICKELSPKLGYDTIFFYGLVPIKVAIDCFGK